MLFQAIKIRNVGEYQKCSMASYLVLCELNHIPAFLPDSGFSCEHGVSWRIWRFSGQKGIPAKEMPEDSLGIHCIYIYMYIQIFTPTHVFQIDNFCIMFFTVQYLITAEWLPSPPSMALKSHQPLR